MRAARIPMWFGVLKIRHREQMRFEERRGKVPIWMIGNRCLAWWSAQDASTAAETPHLPPKPAVPPDSRPIVTFVVAPQNDQWIIRFEGERYGPYPTREAAVDAAYLTAVGAAAKGLDPRITLQS